MQHFISFRTHFIYRVIVLMLKTIRTWWKHNTWSFQLTSLVVENIPTKERNQTFIILLFNFSRIRIKKKMIKGSFYSSCKKFQQIFPGINIPSQLLWKIPKLINEQNIIIFSNFQLRYLLKRFWQIRTPKYTVKC